MRKWFAMCAALALSTGALSAQDPSSMKPGSEQKNLAHFVGNSKIEGAMEASPLGPGGKMTGTEKCSMFEGWHLICDTTGTGPMGSIELRSQCEAVPLFLGEHDAGRRNRHRDI
jgi:hypothetical protein